MWLAFIKPRFLEGHAEPFADIAHEMHFHRPTRQLLAWVVFVAVLVMGWGAIYRDQVTPSTTAPSSRRGW